MSFFFLSALCENEVKDNLKERPFKTRGKKTKKKTKLGSFNLNVQDFKKMGSSKEECRFSKCLSLSIAASVVITKRQAKTKHTSLPQTKAINNG